MRVRNVRWSDTEFKSRTHTLTTACPHDSLVPSLCKVSLLFSLSGQTIHLWTGVHFNATNWTALMTWPEPPSSFVRGDNVDNYVLIVGKPPTKIFYVMPLPHSGREFLISGLEALTNYTCKIIAVLKDGRRRSTDWVGFQTKEGSKFTVCFSFIIVINEAVSSGHTIAPMEFRGSETALLLLRDLAYRLCLVLSEIST